MLCSWPIQLISHKWWSSPLQGLYCTNSTHYMIPHLNKLQASHKSVSLRNAGVSQIRIALECNASGGGLRTWDLLCQKWLNSNLYSSRGFGRSRLQKLEIMSITSQISCCSSTYKKYHLLDVQIVTAGHDETKMTSSLPSHDCAVRTSLHHPGLRRG